MHSDNGRNDLFGDFVTASSSRNTRFLPVSYGHFLRVISCRWRLRRGSGILTITVFGLLATYAGYVIGQYKLRHMSIMNMADAGETLFSTFGSSSSGMKTFGRRLFGFGSTLFLVFIMAAHVLTFSVMMNVVTADSGRRVCTVIYMAAGAAICFVLTLPRKLEKISWISIPCE